MVKGCKKTCAKCKVLKHTNEFGTRKRACCTGLKEYIRSYCFECVKERSAARRKANPEKFKAWKRAQSTRKKQGIERKPRQTYEDNKATRKNYRRRRWLTDPAYRVVSNLRRRVRHALKGTCKSAATQVLVGCTAEECLAHIEAQFTEGMTHDNIHVDHIIPCASFNLKNAEEQRLCFHYSNLQPLFAAENLSKSASITERAANREWNGTMWVDKVLK